MAIPVPALPWARNGVRVALQAPRAWRQRCHRPRSSPGLSPSPGTKPPFPNPAPTPPASSQYPIPSCPSPLPQLSPKSIQTPKLRCPTWNSRGAGWLQPPPATTCVCLAGDKGHGQGTAPGTLSGCTDLLPAPLPPELLGGIPAFPSPRERCAAGMELPELRTCSPTCPALPLPHTRGGIPSKSSFLIILGTSASQQRSASSPGLRYQQETAGSRNSQASPPQETIPGIPGRSSLSRPHLCPARGPPVLSVRQQNPGRAIPSGNASSEPPPSLPKRKYGRAEQEICGPSSICASRLKSAAGGKTGSFFSSWKQ